MGAYVIRRLLLFIPMLMAISVIAFILIQLPPGDYLTSEIMAIAARGEEVDEAVIASLKLRYGLDRPMVEQYFRWISNIILDGDFGRSFHWKQPVSSLIWERLMWTVVISLGSLLFTWLVAFPIGIYSATNQYSIADYLFTFFGFLGKAIPNFLLALVLMWLGYVYFDINMGRPVLGRVPERTLELRQTRRPGESRLGAAGGAGHGRHRRPDPRAARQPAR